MSRPGPGERCRFAAHRARRLCRRAAGIAGAPDCRCGLRGRAVRGIAMIRPQYSHALESGADERT
jgi:hypothetical protein